jgi:hypothetical protein
MTFCAGRSIQVGGMTVVTGGAVMLQAVAFPAVGMRPIEERREPGAGVVALVAGCACEQTGVKDRVRVTGSAGARGTLEDIIDMALAARNAGMCTGQLEARQVVIKGCRQPAVGGMTGAAIRTELAFVRIILLVTGAAVLGRCLEIGNAACTAMAASTGHLGVFPCQLEGDGSMVKGVAIIVNTIMTGQAILPVSQQMGWHETGLDLLVAGNTDGLVKFGIAD